MHGKFVCIALLQLVLCCSFANVVGPATHCLLQLALHFVAYTKNRLQAEVELVSAHLFAPQLHLVSLQISEFSRLPPP